jgi:hypothetical protein
VLALEVGHRALGDRLQVDRGLRRLGALHVVDERRDGDSGQDADNGHDDHQLDQGESAFLFLVFHQNSSVPF